MSVEGRESLIVACDRARNGGTNREVVRFRARQLRRGLHGQVVQEVGRRIVKGELTEGEVIDPGDLQSALNVSRSVIREALRVLAEKGLVGARPKHGTYIRPRRDWSLLDHDVLLWTMESREFHGLCSDLSEVRWLVEPGAARLAAMRRTDQDLDRLKRALGEMEDRTEGVEAGDADVEFHRALFGASHNDLLTRIEEVLAVGLWVRDEIVHCRGGRSDENLSVHAEVLEAIRRGDPEGAEQSSRRLLAFSRTAVVPATAG